LVGGAAVWWRSDGGGFETKTKEAEKGRRKRGKLIELQILLQLLLHVSKAIDT